MCDPLDICGDIESEVHQALRLVLCSNMTIMTISMKIRSCNVRVLCTGGTNDMPLCKSFRWI